jgi:Kef-type K+ transport system membrane component KefB
MQREYGPTIITVIVLGGFIGISFLAMKPELAGVKESVVLYLLGAWQSMAAAAVATGLALRPAASRRTTRFPIEQHRGEHEMIALLAASPGNPGRAHRHGPGDHAILHAEGQQCSATRHRATPA